MTEVQPKHQNQLGQSVNADFNTAAKSSGKIFGHTNDRPTIDRRSTDEISAQNETF